MILATVLNSLETLKKYQDLFADAIWIKSTESYDTSTGVNTISTSETAIKGIPDSFNFNEIDGTKVLQNDLKLYVLADTDLDFTSLVDKVRFDGLDYLLQTVRTTKLGSTNILYTLQLRV